MIRIFIIDDHNVTISGLRSFFRPSRDSVMITHTANSIGQALEFTNDGSFDVILLDLWLPAGDPGSNFKKISEAFPGKPVVIFSAETSLHWQQRMFNFGARAFINKSADKSYIRETLERVLNGEVVLSEIIKDYRTRRFLEGNGKQKNRLTNEQDEIVHLFSDGFPSKAIAGKLGRDRSTINKQLKKIRKILEVSNNVDLIRRILRPGS